MGKFSRGDLVVRTKPWEDGSTYLIGATGIVLSVVSDDFVTVLFPSAQGNEWYVKDDPLCQMFKGGAYGCKTERIAHV